MIRTLIMFWLAWQTVSPEALQHMQAGADAEKQQHFDIAITEFKKATELAPTVAARLRESRSGLHGEPGLWRCHRASKACSGIVT